MEQKVTAACLAGQHALHVQAGDVVVLMNT
jgi:hypothetical protein